MSRSTSHTSARIRQLSASTARPVHAGLTTEPSVDPEPFDDQGDNGSVDFRIRPTCCMGARSARRARKTLDRHPNYILAASCPGT